MRSNKKSEMERNKYGKTTASTCDMRLKNMYILYAFHFSQFLYQKNTQKK